ncbi:phosphatidylglycerol lysyltransferase domain-containing protein [Loktanella salsilacus]|uniref:phosphatidylglycerol lysyltransferase domain-containing protein n=1 Tax=Loktanella salsilacus TaxID=195913 RepID=UPI003735546E
MRQQSTQAIARALQLLVPAAGLGVAIWAFRHLPADAMTTALSGLTGMSPWQWVAALILTGVSYRIIGQLEALWHIALRINTQAYTARRTGRIAVAIGQCTGLASAVAGLLRWHLLRGVAHTAEVARLSLALSLSFTLCLSATALAALWYLSAAMPVARSWLVLPLATTAMGLALWRYGPLLWQQRRLAAGVMFLTHADLLCAGLAFAVFLPGDLPLLQVLAVFTLAFGAGLATHVPMGLGAFDVIVIAFLPAPATAVLPALLAFRLVYFVIPAAAGLVALTRPQPLPSRSHLRQYLRSHAPAIWTLADQGASVWRGADGAALVGHTPLACVVIGDPLGTLPGALQTAARYKCSARAAARLRQQGWSTMRIATEAWIDPRIWSLDGPDKATLRRKLRQAQSGGVSVRQIDPRDMPRDLTRVAEAWCRANGGERGFSMGRFALPLLDAQAVFAIFANDSLHGFVTFQTGPDDWCLDLIRHDGSLPAGAVPAAMVAGFTAAKAAGVAQVSLAATIAQSGPFGWLGRRQDGLAQFKRSFGPHWRPLYHAAPGPLRFVWTATAVFWSVQRPFARLMTRARQLSFVPLHATEGANVRTGPTPKTEATHDKRIRPTSRRARLDPRRWRNRDQPVQYGAFFRRRARNVERRTS